MQNNSINPAFIRRDEAAKYCGVSRRTISDWQARRVIPFVKISRKCVLFRVHDIDRAMQKFTIKAAL